MEIRKITFEDRDRINGALSDEDMGTAYTMPLGEGDPARMLKLLEKEAEESEEPAHSQKNVEFCRKPVTGNFRSEGRMTDRTNIRTPNNAIWPYRR